MLAFEFDTVISQDLLHSPFAGRSNRLGENQSNQLSLSIIDSARNAHEVQLMFGKQPTVKRREKQKHRRVIDGRKGDVTYAMRRCQLVENGNTRKSALHPRVGPEKINTLYGIGKVLLEQTETDVPMFLRAKTSRGSNERCVFVSREIPVISHG